MKDRLPLHPGRVTMTPVPGQTNTYDMVRADQPIEAGDALNKANILPDEVVAYLGLNQENPQPKDAFMAVADAVGDIKTTVRTDLGDDWLLCNGEVINTVNYPSLGNVFQSEVVRDCSVEVVTSNTGINWSVARFINNTYVVLGVDTKASNPYKMYIGYTTNINSPLNIVELTTTLGQTYPSVLDIVYFNGQYRLFYKRGDFGVYTMIHVAYSETLSGIWTHLSDPISSYYPKQVKVGDGVIYYAGKAQDTNFNVLVYSTDGVTFKTSTYKYSSRSEEYVDAIIYNGKIYVLYYSGSAIVLNVFNSFTDSNPIRTISFDNSKQWPYKITVLKNKLCILSQNIIRYTVSVEPTSQEVFSILSVNNSDGIDIFDFGSELLWLSRSNSNSVVLKLGMSTDVVLPAEFKQLYVYKQYSTSTTTSNRGFTGSAISSNGIIFDPTAAPTFTSNKDLVMWKTSNRRLPTISVDSAYVYMRVK